MHLHTIESAAIRKIGYDAGRHILEVEFKSGNVYDYFEVSGREYKELESSPSKGKYVNLHIKPTHPHIEVTEFLHHSHR
jgi:hypothetical protein